MDVLQLSSSQGQSAALRILEEAASRLAAWRCAKGVEVACPCDLLASSEEEALVDAAAASQKAAGSHDGLLSSEAEEVLLQVLRRRVLRAAPLERVFPLCMHFGLALKPQLQDRLARMLFEEGRLQPPPRYLQRFLKCIYTAAESAKVPLSDAFCDAVFSHLGEEETEEGPTFLAFEELDRPCGQFLTCGVLTAHNSLGLRTWAAGFFMSAYLAQLLPELATLDLEREKERLSAASRREARGLWIEALLRRLDASTSEFLSTAKGAPCCCGGKCVKGGQDESDERMCFSVLELGCGVGLTAAAVARRCAAHCCLYTATDVDVAAVANCVSNLRLNDLHVVDAGAAEEGSGESASEAEAGDFSPVLVDTLDVASVQEDAPRVFQKAAQLLEKGPGSPSSSLQGAAALFPIVAGADLLYDPSLNEALADAFKFLLEESAGANNPRGSDAEGAPGHRLCVAVSAVRDPATREHFLRLLHARGLAAVQDPRPVRQFLAHERSAVIVDLVYLPK